MAFVDNPNNQDDNQTTSANPLEQSGQQNMSQADSAYNQAASQGSNVIQSGQDSQGNQQQAGTLNKKAPKASSGMFTNIQKYVAKNKPQANKMAGAVKQDFGKQASEIRNAADKKEKDQANLINANTGIVEDQVKWAGSEVDKIMGVNPQTPSRILPYDSPPPLRTMPAEIPTDPSELNRRNTIAGFNNSPDSPTTTIGSGDTALNSPPASPPMTYNPSQESIDRFKALSSGQVEGLSGIGDLDLSQQKNKMAALQQLAGRANTEQGRRDLLGNVFQKQGQYSRGMSGLDQLITSGNKDARNTLIKGTQQEADTLATDINKNITDAYGAKSGYNKLIGGISGSVSDLLYGDKGAVTGIEGNIQTELDTLLNKYGGVSKSLKDSFGSGEGNDYSMTQEQLDLLGLKAGTNLYGTDLGAYINNVGSDPSAKNAMTSEQARRLQILSDMGGKESDFSYINPEQIEKYDVNKLFDINAFNSAISKNKEEFDSQKLNEKQSFIDARNKSDSILNNIKKGLSNLNFTGANNARDFNSLVSSIENSRLGSGYIKDNKALFDSYRSSVTDKEAALASIYGGPNQGGGSSGRELITGASKGDLYFGNSGNDIKQAELDALRAKFNNFKKIGVE